MVDVLDCKALLGVKIGFGGGSAFVLGKGDMLVQERIVLQGTGALAGTGSKLPDGL